MDELNEAISQQDWARAQSIGDAFSIEPSFVAKIILHHQLSAVDQVPLTISHLNALVDEDPVWTARLLIKFFERQTTSPVCSDNDTESIVDILDRATQAWTHKILLADGAPLSSLLEDVVMLGGDQSKVSHLQELIKSDSDVAEACSAKWLASQRTSRWKLFHDLYSPSGQEIKASKPRSCFASGSDVDCHPGDEDTEDTGWAELNLDLSGELGDAQFRDDITFSDFCLTNLDALAIEFGSTLQLSKLRRLISSENVGLDCFQLFEPIPLHARPSDLDYGQDLIALLPKPNDSLTGSNSKVDVLTLVFCGPLQSKLTHFSDSQFTDWYLRRVQAIDAYTGCTDAALEIVQHASASGVLGLETVGEDLSFLSKLVYKAPNPEGQVCDWSLEEWKKRSPDEVVESYLAGSSSQSLVNEIQSRVLPYLNVIESRRARSHSPDAESTVSVGIRTWTLKQFDKPRLLLPLIKASSPTLKVSQRIIKNNEDLARIAIACLYTSPSTDEWDCMTQIYECMPAFPKSEPPPLDFEPAKFLRNLLIPRSSAASVNSPQDVYESLQDVNTGGLSLILDALDEHLTTAEVLARWNVPTRLADLLTKLSGDQLQQERLATRVARQEGGLEMESEEEWEALLEAMMEMLKPGRALDLLDKAQVLRLFFSGLLTSGKFNIAKALFSSSSEERTLDTAVQEELVIEASREFYDNAESGDLNCGDMKIALECLSAAPQTVRIQRERDFIEGTSRILSFRLQSQPGVLMSPIEVRLTSNKLDLIQKLLSVDQTAYQHPSLILELVNKLVHGEDPLAQTKALSLVVDVAVSLHDFRRASESCQRMLIVFEEMKKKSRKEEPMNNIEEVSQILWTTCEKLGTYQDFDPQIHIKGQRAQFLAHAVIICPAEEISSLLAKSRQVEASEALFEDSSAEQAVASVTPLYKSWNFADFERPSAGIPMTSAVNLSSEFASRTIGKAASLFPFKTRHVKSDFGEAPKASYLDPSDLASMESTVDPLLTHPQLRERVAGSAPASSLLSKEDSRFAVDTERLTAALSNKFTSGVGWLIGADE